MALICSTFPAYTVEMVNELEDITPVLKALYALGVFRDMQQNGNNSPAAARAIVDDWRAKTGSS